MGPNDPSTVQSALPARDDDRSSSGLSDLEAVKEVARARSDIVREIEKRIVGQRAVIDHLITALLARGHCLFIGVPGLAKTLLISTLAEALDLSFQRIQFRKRETSPQRVELARVLSPARLRQLQELVLRVPVADHVVQHAVALSRATRPGPEAPDFVREYVSWGAGPRASQVLILAGKARAILDGRFAVSTDDVRALARPTFEHRLIVNYKAEAEGIKAATLVDRLLAVVRT